MDVPASTLADVENDAKQHYAIWARRGFLALVLAFVVAGLLGYLGVHSVTDTASGGGYQMSLHYARIARPGLNVPWQLTVTHAGGFSGPVEIDLASNYLNMIDVQGATPRPTRETQDGTWWRMTFDPPRGDTLVFSLGMAVQPGTSHGESATVRLVEHGRPVDQIHFTTTLLP